MDLNKNSILLILGLSRPGNRRKVNPNLVEVDADREAIHVAKELLDSEELQAILHLDSKVRLYVYSRCLPCSTLKEGVYRLPVALIDEVDKHLRAMQEERCSLIDQFITAYPERKEAAKARLRELFNEEDYREPDVLRSAFGFTWRYLTFDLPKEGVLSSALYQQEKEKAKAEIQTEVEDIKLALRQGFAELIDHAASRLVVKEDGKKVIFRDSMVKNLEEFFTYFGKRNIVDDKELAILVERAKSVLAGVSPDTLRENNTVRNQIKEVMQGIKETMNQNLMLAPHRKFFTKGA